MRLRAHIVRPFLCLFALTVASPADAQEQPAAPAEPAKAPATDIVRLKNGGMLRGTIAELIPNETVVIVLVSGETRRISMADVDYAGPEATQPPPATAVAPAEATPAPAAPQKMDETVPRVEFVSPEPVTVFARSSEGAEYQMVCTTPCDAHLDAGYHHFALMRGGTTKRVEAGGATVTGNATIEAKYRSRNGLRTAGVVGGIIGAGVGGILWATASSETEDCSLRTTTSSGCVTIDTTNYGQLWIGRILVGASVIAGLVLLAIPDGGSVKVLPASSALRVRGQAAARDALTVAVTPASALLRGSF